MIKILDHLKAKWKDVNCPMCNHNQWSASEEVFEIRKYYGGNVVLGQGPILPIIPVTCNNCGNTVLVNAIKAGVVDANNEDTKES